MGKKAEARPTPQYDQDKYLEWAQGVPRLRAITDIVNATSQFFAGSNFMHPLPPHEWVGLLRLDQPQTAGMYFEDRLHIGLPEDVSKRMHNTENPDQEGEPYYLFAKNMRFLLGRYRIYVQHKTEKKNLAYKAYKNLYEFFEGWAEIMKRQLALGGTPSGIETDLTLAMIHANNGLFDPHLQRIMSERSLPPDRDRLFTRARGKLRLGPTRDSGADVLQWLDEAPVRDVAVRKGDYEKRLSQLRHPTPPRPVGHSLFTGRMPTVDQDFARRDKRPAKTVPDGT